MNYQDVISKRVDGVPPSGIRKFFDIVSEMKGAISLGVGEPDFITPWNIREAAIYSLEKGRTQYTSNWGTIELRREIAHYLAARHDVSYDPKNEILVTVGASEGIDIALRALINPGDEVLVPEPSYVSYMPGVVFAGGTPVPVVARAENAFRITAEAVREKITPRTKALILPYPNNPTGAIMEKKYLLEVARALEGTDIIVISDEIYSELTYSGEHVSFAALPGMRERTILLNGMSKAFAMTGWRIGYACAPAELLYPLFKIHQYAILCAPITSQMAAEEAFRSARDNHYKDVLDMRRIYNQRRCMLVDAFNDMGLDCFEPLGAFYVFPCIKNSGLTSEEFCTRLLSEQKVAAVPGTAFGPSGEGYMRCAYAASTANITEAIRRIGIFIKQFG